MGDFKMYKTNYFTQPWTWIKRVAVFGIFVILVIAWELNEQPWEYAWIKYVIFGLLSIGLFLSPVDDIMVDKAFFYHLKTSLLKAKTKVHAFGYVNMAEIILDYLQRNCDLHQTIKL
jgi:hypothetical protein